MGKKKSFIVTLNIIVVATVTLGILSTSLFFFYYLSRMTGEDAMNTLQKDMEQITYQLERSAQQAVDLANSLACDAELSRAVDRFYGDDLGESVEGRQMMDYIVQNAVSMNPYVVNIAITKEDEIIQYNRYGINILEDINVIKEAKWYDNLMRGSVQQVFKVKDQGLAGKVYFTCATKFKTTTYKKREDENRLVIMTLQLEELEKLIRNTAELKKISLLLYDEEEQQIVYNIAVGEAFEEMFADWGQQDIQELAESDHQFVTLTSQNELTGWILMGFVENLGYRQVMSSISPWILEVVLLILIGSIFISLLVFKNVSKPLKNVMKGMEDVGNQDFYSIQEDEQYVEFAELVRVFNQMSMQIKQLIADIEQKEHEKRIEEFKALEYQINPHFIYNTLDGIKWVALMNHSKPTAEIIESFSSFLRLTLSGGQELVQVQREMEITREYIKIMIFRNNMNVRIEYDISEEVKTLYTLKLVLQPVVENCFCHAFDHLTMNPTIRICCYVQDAVLVIEVSDNGKGLQKEKTSGDNHILTGIGINNIDERIKLWHGNEYGFSMESLPEGGTKVTLRQSVIKTIEGRDEI